MFICYLTISVCLKYVMLFIKMTSCNEIWHLQGCQFFVTLNCYFEVMKTSFNIVKNINERPKFNVKMTYAWKSYIWEIIYNKLYNSCTRLLISILYYIMEIFIKMHTFYKNYDFSQ